MQIIKTTAAAINNAEQFTMDMVKEALTKYAGLTEKRLKTALKGSDEKQRAELVDGLEANPDFAETFKLGGLELEYECLPDLVIENAGKNKRGTGTRKSQFDLTGEYHVVKRGLKSTAETDPEKAAIWKHVWESKSFEEFFKNCPPKGVTKTQRVITARSEILWALKSGWIKAGPALAPSDPSNPGLDK